MDKRFEPHARLAAVIFLLIGCFFVLRPFLAAMLFAACVIMVGLIAATVTVLYRTLRQIIATITPGDDV